jgi:arylsulfatase A-like enzyme
MRAFHFVKIIVVLAAAVWAGGACQNDSCRPTAASRDGVFSLPANQITVARVLHDAGYVTGGFGKWGLGNPGTTGAAEEEGFDEFFGYYDQVYAHDYYKGKKAKTAGNVTKVTLEALLNDEA